jgi:hypothetical protein
VWRAVGLVLVGLFLGAVGALVQAYQVHVLSTRVPLGTIVVLAALVPVARAGAWSMGSRAGALALSLGWLVATLLMGTQTPSGDLVLNSGTRQVAYLIGGTVLLSAACGFPLVVPEEAAPEEPEPAADHR